MKPQFLLIFILSLMVTWLIGWNFGFNLGQRNGYDTAVINNKVIFECKKRLLETLPKPVKNQCETPNEETN